METTAMYRSLILLCVSCVHVLHSTSATRDISSYGNTDVSLNEHMGAPHTGLGRSRRSPSLGWSPGGSTGQRYTARSTRTYSNGEIDAFNQELHRKRPKFIGKRQAVDEPESRLIDAVGNPSVDCTSSRHETDEGSQFAMAQKRSPPRKFVGRRSWSSDDLDDSEAMSSATSSLVADNDDVKRADQAAPRRKFVGKRPTNRKFVGRRNVSGRELDEGDEAAFEHRVADGDSTWPNTRIFDADQSTRQDEDHVTEAKRAARKFVG